MNTKEYFPQRPEAYPMIYAYSDSNPLYKGLLKVGYTEKGVEKRVAQQYPTKPPAGIVPYKIILAQSAMRNDGTRSSKGGMVKGGCFWYCRGVYVNKEKFGEGKVFLPMSLKLKLLLEKLKNCSYAPVLLETVI